MDKTADQSGGGCGGSCEEGVMSEHLVQSYERDYQNGE